MSREFKFQYIASGQNPADLATRGLSVIELNHCSLWWHGKSWLGSNHIFWPAWNLLEVTPENLEEIRNSKSSAEDTMVAGVDGKWDKDVFLFGTDKPRYSSSLRLLRVSVYVFRFIKMKMWNK